MDMTFARRLIPKGGFKMKKAGEVSPAFLFFI
jgi:hypothetical protein